MEDLFETLGEIYNPKRQSLQYHNTTEQSQDYVREAVKNAKTQSEKVIAILKTEGRKTPSEMAEYFSNSVPLTSVRRAISNLVFEGVVRKLDDTKIGIYGKPEHYYNLVENQGILF